MNHTLIPSADPNRPWSNRHRRRHASVPQPRQVASRRGRGPVCHLCTPTIPPFRPMIQLPQTAVAPRPALPPLASWNSDTILFSMSADDSDEGGRDYVCGAETESTDGPCQFPVSGPDDRCHAHPSDGSGPPDGHGSGDPDHHMGSGPGDIEEKVPDGAKPAMTHALHAVQDDPHGTMTWLEDNDPRGHDWVRAKWASYLADAPYGPNTAKSDDVLHACLMLYAVRAARHRQITQGLVDTVPLTDESGDPVIDPETGEPYQVEREHARNLPTNRVAREARSLLKDAGVLDDPESKKAEAMGWGSAAREVALEVDSDVQDTDTDGSGGDR